jgi:hypothetical protein
MITKVSIPESTLDRCWCGRRGAEREAVVDGLCAGSRGMVVERKEGVGGCQREIVKMTS